LDPLKSLYDHEEKKRNHDLDPKTAASREREAQKEGKLSQNRSRSDHIHTENGETRILPVKAAGLGGISGEAIRRGVGIW